MPDAGALFDLLEDSIAIFVDIIELSSSAVTFFRDRSDSE